MQYYQPKNQRQQKQQINKHRGNIQMKKISIIAGIILCLHLIFAPTATAQAATIETLADDTLYYETVIEETASFSPMASNTAKTKTKRKTAAGYREKSLYCWRGTGRNDSCILSQKTGT